MLLLGGVRPADLAAKNIVPTRVQANSRSDGKPHGRPGRQYESGLVAVRVQMNKLATLLINIAALETSGRQLGIGVGEDAAVELDLDTGELIGIPVSESLLVDSARLQRRGLTRTGIVTRLISQGDRLKPGEWLARTPPPPAAPAGPMREMPIVEPGQNRQLAAWRLFRQAGDPGSSAIRQRLNGYSLTVFPAGSGNIALEIRPAD